MKFLTNSLYVFLALFLGLYLVMRSGQEKTPIGQERIERDGVIMLESTTPVNLDLQSRVLDLLIEKATERGIFVYAITDISEREGYFYVSVAGLPIGSDAMRLSESLWLGNVVLADLPGYPGMVMELPENQPNTTDPQSDFIGGAVNIFPWRDKTTATYGVLGVHNCGFSLNGWKAVDFMPDENMVYASNEGSVSYVCRDDIQVSMRVGNFLYGHLEDTGQQVGDSYYQGQAIAGMVPGTYDAACGYAQQQPENYHVHFCYQPSWANQTNATWSAEGWTVNTNNNNWVKDGDPFTIVEPGGTLTANWANANVGIIPGPAAGGNFWDNIVSGLFDVLNSAVGVLPYHSDFDFVNRTLNPLTPLLALIYVLFFSVFDMSYAMWAFGIIFVLESVRRIYAAWMWIKRAIPIVG